MTNVETKGAASSAAAPAESQIDFGYDEGGVPWFLLLLYVSFLVFFTWYVLEYQLPDFLHQGPGVEAAPAAQSAPR